MTEYPRYAAVCDKILQQGDFIFNLEVPTVRNTAETPPPILIETLNTIVITQSCDIPKEAVENVVLLPVWDIPTLRKLSTVYKNLFSDTGLEQIRLGRVVAFHMLDKCDIAGFVHDFMIVQFEGIIVRPKEAILEFISNDQPRLRLLPPYREELAQRFGMFFSRVACPKEIPKFR